MENYIKFFYDIDSKNIRQKEKNYYFNDSNYIYELLICNYDLNYLNDVFIFHNELLKNGIYCNQIILNKNKSIITQINDKKYILIRSNYDFDKKINLENIMLFNYFSVQNNKFDCSDWKTLWELKMDYFGYQLNQFGYNHPLLRESFGYYSGYVELAISLLNIIPKCGNNVLSHKRIKVNSTLHDLYNPFNLILDNKVRDAAEYFKSKIFEKNIYCEIITYLSNVNLESHEYILFFIRMLYPSFYFDQFENNMNNALDDNNIKYIIDNHKKYEDIIKEIYKYISKITNIPKIDWLMY